MHRAPRAAARSTAVAGACVDRHRERTASARRAPLPVSASKGQRTRLPIALDSRSSAPLRESARTGSVGNTMSAALLSCTIRARSSSATATGPAAGRSAPPPRCGRLNARHPECADARAPAPTQRQCNTGAIRMNQFNPALNRIPQRCAARQSLSFNWPVPISIPFSRIPFKTDSDSESKKADRLASRVFIRFLESLPAPVRPPPDRHPSSIQPCPPFTISKHRNSD
ncbi:hypothetical protein X898_4021 [Burkholderia pseudomallei ABCPW 91]|nr:hypothetical protein X898_4021 [Burkholderia pseudomallei ABCPW 91]